MTNNSERIRALAPGNAAYFRLKMQLSDNSVRIFPPEEGGYYKLSEPPYHVAAGSYLLCFFDGEQRPLIQHDQTFRVYAPTEMARSPQGQLPLNFNLMGPASHGQASMAAASYVAPAPAAPSPAPTAVAPPTSVPTDPGATEENDLEFRKYLHAMDLEERQQDFIRNSTYVKEVGELFLLNRLMRRDMMEMQRSMVQHAQHAFRDIEQAKTTVHGLIALQNTVLEHVEKRHSSPPPPPADYVGLGFAAIGLLKEVSVALIQRGQPERASQPVPTQPQLPAEGSSPVPASPPAAETARATDVIDRIGKQLKSLTELELAQAMSSPQAWTALLQRCMAPDAHEGTKEPSQKSEIGPEGRP